MPACKTFSPSFKEPDGLVEPARPAEGLSQGQGHVEPAWLEIVGRFEGDDRLVEPTAFRRRARLPDEGKVFQDLLPPIAVQLDLVDAEEPSEHLDHQPGQEHRTRGEGERREDRIPRSREGESAEQEEPEERHDRE